MELLIKITSEPIQMVRMSQGARLVSSGSADIERRKALARRMSFHRSYSSGAGSMPVEDIQRINRAFAKGQVSRTQSPTQPQQPAVQHRAPRPAARPVAQSAPAPQPSMADLAPSKSMLANMPSGMTVGTEAVLNETMAAAVYCVHCPLINGRDLLFCGDTRCVRRDQFFLHHGTGRF